MKKVHCGTCETYFYVCLYFTYQHNLDVVGLRIYVYTKIMENFESWTRIKHVVILIGIFKLIKKGFLACKVKLLTRTLNSVKRFVVRNCVVYLC